MQNPQNAGAPSPAQTTDLDLTADSGAVDTGNAEGTQGADEGTQEAATFSAEDFKKLQKQLAQQDRRIGRMTASKYQTQRELQELRAWKAKYDQEAQAKANAKPSPDQFQSFDEYTAAMSRHAAMEAIREQQGGNNQPATQGRVPAEEQQWHTQMQDHAVRQAQELAKHIPDFEQTWNGNAELIDAMPYEIEKAFYQSSQHPALALYVIAREGLLPDLFEATPQQAAQLIAQATQMGVQQVQSQASKPQGGPPNKATGAPQPLAPNKAAGAGAKSEDELSGAELRKKYGF